jgi:hypothetical protein
MTPFWHLTTLSCIPYANPQARLQEQRIFRLAAADAITRAQALSQQRARTRWNGKAKTPSVASAPSLRG